MSSGGFVEKKTVTIHHVERLDANHLALFNDMVLVYPKHSPTTVTLVEVSLDSSYTKFSVTLLNTKMADRSPWIKTRDTPDPFQPSLCIRET